MRLNPPRIDFTTRRSSSVIGIALLVVGCVFAAAAVRDDATHGDEMTRLDSELHRAKKELSRVELRAKGDAGPIVEGNVPTDWPGRLLTPWGELFQALEHAQTDSIALLSIEPDAGRGRLRLSGEAKNAEALAAYLQALQSNTCFDGLRILMQQVKQNDPQQPIEFSVESRWNGRKPVEKSS